jgi:hypothetical protein
VNDEELRRRISRGTRMREWAEGTEGLFACFDAAKADYLKAIEASAPAETQLREDIYHRIRALADIRRVMEVVITDGAGASATIAHLSKLSERKKNVA